MIEYTLYIYTGIKRNNIISLFNIESKKKRVKVVQIKFCIFKDIYFTHLASTIYIWKEDNEQMNKLRIMIGFTHNQKKNIQLYFYS